MSVDGRMALRRALLAAVLGGAAAVGAEVVFTRELALLFGVTAPAAATVVSVYLGGMALGSVLGGRLADRAGDRAGWVYVIAELAAGAWAWLFPVFFAIAWDLLDARGGGLIETGLVTVVLVGPAAVASGATFPGLTRAVGQGPAIRWLYGANALGAALGGVGVGLYLPEWLGFSGSLGAAGLLSVMAAVVLGVSTRGEAPAEVSVASDPDPVSPRLAGTMQAVIGGVGMASEIGWTRILEQTGPNPGSLCFPIVLAAYLVGLALGTVVLAPVLARLGERRGLGMGALLAALGPLLGVLALLVLPEERLIGHLVAPGPGNGLVFDLTGVQVSIDRLAAVLLAVMLPGMASGAAFPIAARALSRARGMGQGVGFAGAAGVGAAMVASLWLGLLPVQGIGTIYSLLAMATLGAVAAVALVPGKLRIAVECHTCFDWLMPSMDALRERWPEVEQDIVSGFQADPVGLLHQDRAELAIVSELDDTETDMIFHPLFEFEMVAILPLGHPYLARPHLVAQDFAGQALITYPVPDDMLDLVRQVLRPAGVEPPRRTTELTVGMLQLVASGRGFAALPLWAVNGYLERGYVARQRIGPDGLTARLYAVVPKRLAGNAYLADFVQVMRETSLLALPGIRML